MNSNEQEELLRDGAIIFGRYISDGPGYSGPLEIRIDGCSFTVRTRGTYADTYSHRLRQELPRVAAVRQPGRSELNAFWPQLDAVTRRNYPSPADHEADRIRVLSFEDDSRGALLVHGEPEYWSILWLPNGGHPYSESFEVRSEVAEGARTR